jgi:hypothetical protein
MRSESIIHIVIHIVIVFLLLGAVGSGCDRREQQRCRMANEYVVAKVGGEPRSLEILRLDGEHLAVFWSADRGVFYALVNNDGMPVSKVYSLQQHREMVDAPKTYWANMSEPVLDAVSLSPVLVSKNRVALAMLCHQGKNNATVMTALLDVSGHQVRWMTETGKTGPFARSVSMTMVDDVLVVGWQDTRSDPQSIVLAAIHGATGEIVRRAVMDTDASLYGPALARNGSGAIVVWSEVDEKGHSAILRSAPLSLDSLGKGTARSIDSLKLFDASTDIIPHGDGFAVLFRDNRDGDSTEEFYFTRLDRSGKRIQSVRRISRADGPQGPKLVAGTRSLFSAAVRSYNNNFLVGFNRMDSAGTKAGGEFQVYADKCDFVRAGIASRGDDAILVYAENADTGGRILASTISCGQNR